MTSNDANEVLNEERGNHRRQSQKSRVELGLGPAMDLEGRTIWGL